MNKFILIALALILSFSCNRKSTDGWIPLTKKELKQHKPLLDSILRYNELVGQIIVGGNDSMLTSSVPLQLDTSSFYIPITFNKLDTTLFVLKHVSSWEEGTIETITGKMVIPYRIGFEGIYQYDYSEAKLEKASGKLPDGTIIYCPLELEGLDLVEFYFKRKK